MIVSKTAKIWLDYHRAHSKNNTVRAYKWTIGKFCGEFGDTDLSDLSVDDILSFLNQITEGRKLQTKRVRFSHLTAFFYFIKNNIDSDINNPCDSPMLRKLFRQKIYKQQKKQFFLHVLAICAKTKTVNFCETNL